MQKFGYALFFITDKALDYLNKSDGWETGIGPSVTVVDKGLAHSLTTTTAKSDIYAFFFDQRGLMAGLGLQGTKLTKVPSEEVGVPTSSVARRIQQIRRNVYREGGFC